MNDTLVFENYQPQNIVIDGGGSVIGLTTVLVNGVDVTEGSVAYVVVPTKVSELENDSGYLTAETDPTVPYFIKQITISDINRWNNKQDLLVSGNNIKTINDNSILGSGNIEITETPYTAGTGIEINNHEISNTITSYNDLTDLPTIPTKTSNLTNDSDYVVSSSLSEVAFSGSYLDLDDQPLIPQATSELENDSGFITKEVNDLDNYVLKQYLDLILPKASGTGTSITLDDTVGAKMKCNLSPSEMTQEDTPTPTNPQNIHTTTGDNSILVRNINLWDEEWEEGYYNSTGGKQIATTAIRSKNYIPVQPNTTYYFYNGESSNGRINFFDKNKTFISTSTGYNGTKTTPNNCYYILISTATTYGGTYLNNICVNISNANINGNYYPYDGNTYPLTLGTLELNKIGDYEDVFIKATNETGLESGKWYLKKNIGKVVLDGSDESWGTTSTDTTDVRRMITNAISSLIKPPSSASVLPNIVCNRYIQKTNNQTYAKEQGFSVGTSGRIEIYDNTYNTTDATLYTTYLSTNNLEVYYPLLTPTYTLLNDTLQTQLDNIWNMKSKVNQTNISQVNDDLPMVISASAFKVIGG